jgi:hypothetical protein
VADRNKYICSLQPLPQVRNITRHDGTLGHQCCLQLFPNELLEPPLATNSDDGAGFGHHNFESSHEIGYVFLILQPPGVKHKGAALWDGMLVSEDRFLGFDLIYRNSIADYK